MVVIMISIGAITMKSLSCGWDGPQITASCDIVVLTDVT